MGSLSVPHQGSNKADALSAELQGLQFNGFGMLTPVTDLVNRHYRTEKNKQKEIARGGDLSRKK